MVRTALLYLIISVVAIAQPLATITGHVRDRSSNTPISYATVSLWRSDDTSARPIRGALTLKDGTFLLLFDACAHTRSAPGRRT